MYNNTTTATPTVLVMDVCLPYREYRTLPEAQEITTSSIFVCILLFLISLLAIAGNSLVILVVMINKELQNNSNILLCWLAATDLFVGFVNSPLYSIHYVLTLIGKVNCSLWIFIAATIYCLDVLSFLTLGLISIDRYLAIFYTLRYPILVTQPRIIGVTVTVWLSWIAYVGLNNFSTLTTNIAYIFKYVVVGIETFNLLLTSFIYLRIFLVARKHSAQIASQEHLHSAARVVARETRIARTMAVIMLTLFVCYIPFIGAVLSNAVLGYTTEIRFFVYPWVVVVMFSNSCLNPGIYLLRNSQIRAAVYRLLGIRVRVVQESTQNPSAPVNAQVEGNTRETDIAMRG